MTQLRPPHRLLLGTALLLAVGLGLGVFGLPSSEAKKRPRLKPPVFSVTADKTEYALGEVPVLAGVLFNRNEEPVTVSTSYLNIQGVSVKRGRTRLKPTRGIYFLRARADRRDTLQEVAPGGSTGFALNSVRLAVNEDGSPRGLIVSVSYEKGGLGQLDSYLLEGGATYSLRFLYKYLGPPDVATPPISMRRLRSNELRFSVAKE